MQCEQVQFWPEKKVEIKVTHSVVAVGTLGARAAPYLRHSNWKVEPIPLVSLFYAHLIQNRYPFIVGLIRVFQSSDS